jgi:hypothetical protein
VIDFTHHGISEQVKILLVNFFVALMHSPCDTTRKFLVNLHNYLHFVYF